MCGNFVHTRINFVYEAIRFDDKISSAASVSAWNQRSVGKYKYRESLCCFFPFVSFFH